MAIFTGGKFKIILYLLTQKFICFKRICFTTECEHIKESSQTLVMCNESHISLTVGKNAKTATQEILRLDLNYEI